MGRGGGRAGGDGGIVKRVLWMFFVACVVVAIWGEVFTSPTALLPTLARKSAQIEKTVHEWVGKVGLTEDGSVPNIKVPAVVPSGKGTKDKGESADKK